MSYRAAKSNTTPSSPTPYHPVVRFAIIEAAYWCIMATYASFMVTFALAKGFSQSITSVMLAGYLLCGFAGQFFWGSLCDRFKTNKKVFIPCIIVTMMIQLAMFYVTNPLLFGLLYGMLGFSLGPMGSILDAWMLKELHHDMKLYGISRGAGSIGYGMVMLVMGYAIRSIGYWIMPVTSSIIALLTIGLAFITRDAEFAEAKEGSRISAADIFSILKIPSYTSILLVLLFVSLSTAPINNFKISILESVGGDVGTQGLDSCIGCFIQFILFEIAGLLTRFAASKRIFAGTVAIVLAVLCNLLANGTWMIILGSVMVNITYSLMIPGSREIVMQEIDPKYQTTGVAVVDACYSFLGGMIAMLYTGSLMDNFGIAWTLRLSLVLTLIPMVILLLRSQSNRK